MDIFFQNTCRKALYSFCFILITSSISVLTNAQTLESLSASFELNIRGSNNSSSKGHIHFESPDLLLLTVVEPLEQLMLYGNDMLRIYYPNTGEILDFKDSSIRNLSFFYGFLRAIKDRHDATETGFVFISSRFENDTLYMTYKPPDKYQSAGIEMTNVYYKNLLQYNYIRDAEEKILATSKYGNYKTIKGLNIPHEVLIISYNQDGDITYAENATFSDVQINQIKEFRSLLPDQLKRNEK